MTHESPPRSPAGRGRTRRPARCGPRGRHFTNIGDAILLNGMLVFSEAALRGPKLKAKYGARAERYVALAKRVMEKWDRRGKGARDLPLHSEPAGPPRCQMTSGNC